MYLGRNPGTPVDGWTLDSFAGGWVAATLAGDPYGPFIFNPGTVRAEGRELNELRASYRRFQTDPETEREQTGAFWDRWSLQPGGTLWPRDLPAPKHARSKP